MPAHCSWRTRGVCRFVKGPGFQCDVCNLAPSKTALLPSKAFQPGLLVDEGPSRAVFPEQGGGSSTSRVCSADTVFLHGWLT